LNKNELKRKRSPNESDYSESVQDDGSGSNIEEEIIQTVDDKHWDLRKKLINFDKVKS